MAKVDHADRNEYKFTRFEHEITPTQAGILATAVDSESQLSRTRVVLAQQNETLVTLTLRQWLADLVNNKGIYQLGARTAGLYATPVNNLDLSCRAEPVVKKKGLINQLLASLAPEQTPILKKTAITGAQWRTNDIFYALRLPLEDTSNQEEALIACAVMKHENAMAWWSKLNTLASMQQFTEFGHLLLGMDSWGNGASPALGTERIVMPSSLSGLKLKSCTGYRVYPGVSAPNTPASALKPLTVHK